MGARECAIVGGIVLVLLGLLGFVNNPIIGVFAVNTAHNLLHIVLGLVLLAGAFTGLGSSMALKIVGVIYAIVAVLAFIAISGDGMLLGIFAINMADKWLLVVVAVLALIGGFALRDDKPMMM